MTNSGGRQSFDVNRELGNIRQRWGIQQTPYATAAFAVLAAALLLGTIGHILYLTAGDFEAQFDGIAWYNVGTGLAIIAVALMVLLRWQSPGGGGSRDDLRIVGGLGVLSAAWMVLAFFFGFLDDRLDPEDSWFLYSQLFAFLAMAWCAISRPIPASLGTTGVVSIGGIALGVAAAAFVVGAILAMSDDFSTYSKGVTLQDLGKIISFLTFAAFLGLAPKEAEPSSAAM